MLTRQIKKKLKSGDFVGVNFEDCLERLSKIVSVKFTKTHKDTLDLLRRKRNKIEHFFEPEPLTSFKSVLAHGLDFSIEFIEKYLNSNLENNEEQMIDSIKTECFKLNTFVKEKINKIKPKLDKQKVVLNCYECNNMSVVVKKDKEKMECLFCYRTIPENEYENLYHNMLGIYRPKELLLVGNMICPECENINYFVETKDEKSYFCLFCHYTAKKDLFSLCSRCNITYYDKNGESFQCSSCWRISI